MTWLGDLGAAILGAAYTNRLLVLAAASCLIVGLVAIGAKRGWHRAVGRHPGRSILILVPMLAVAIPLGWYLGSPLIVSTSVDEPAPSVLMADAPAASAGSREAPESTVRPDRASPRPAPSFATPAPVRLVGRFEGSDEFHFGRGTARLIETTPGSYIVRLEDFAVRNGPDLYVYLSPDPGGYTADAVELGRLKADRGNQNYTVPAGMLDDPGDAASIVIWCKQFSHLFATAPLAEG
jgi:electron transfer DM13